MATVETPADSSATPITPPPQSRDWRGTVASLGGRHPPARDVGVVAAIWIAFHILSGGDFLTARNMWNLSVQSTSIAIMATGMVLIIVSRNIDLSVGSLLGFLGYVMALVQTDGVIAFFGCPSASRTRQQGIRLDRRLAVGILLGALVGGLQGFIIAYGGVPAFIVTLGGFLVWRGMIFRTGGKQGQTLAPLERHVPADRRRPGGVARRVEELAVRTARLCPHRPDPRPGPPPAAAPRPRAAADVDGRHVRRRRVRRRAGRRRARGQQLHLADHREPDRHRLPGRDPDRRHGADELPRPPAPLRPVRVRLRRQPRGGRARRHQHPPDRHVDVRPHGRARGR